MRRKGVFLNNCYMDNLFGSSSAQKGGLPGKDFSLFNIAPLDPVLKDRVYGEHAGQTA
jgi:hypothetical protein